MRTPTLVGWLLPLAISSLVMAAAPPQAPPTPSSAPRAAASTPTRVPTQAPAPAQAQTPTPPTAAAPAPPPAAAEVLTVDQLVARHVAARGGLEKIAAIQTLMVTGRIHAGNDAGQPLTVRLRRPNQIRQDFIVQMRTGARAYDGTVGWARLPSSTTGSPTVELLAGGPLKDIQDEAENGIDGPLVNYREKGHRAELAGVETFDGKRCFVAVIRLRTGHVMRLYLDASTFLEVGERLTRTMNGKAIEIESTVGDHRPVSGVLFPHLYISGTAESPREMRLQVERIVANPVSPPIDETIFKNPGGARR